MISRNTSPITHETYPEQAIYLEADLNQWHERMEGLMDQDARIIAFRGAGSANGIEPEAARHINQLLLDYITDVTANGTRVALMYDGDPDTPERPYLGSVFGALVDSLAENTLVTSMAVQTKDWYEPVHPGAALASARGNTYETYVFNKDMDEITPSLQGRGMAHSALTQSSALVAYKNYEQIIIGATGPIATEQLHDLSQKAQYRNSQDGPVPVTVLSARVNPDLDDMLRDTVENDPKAHRRARAVEKIAQRANYPYGLLCTPAGELDLDPAEYPSVLFSPVIVR